MEQRFERRMFRLRHRIDWGGSDGGGSSGNGGSLMGELARRRVEKAVGGGIGKSSRGGGGRGDSLKLIMSSGSSGRLGCSSVWGGRVGHILVEIRHDAEESMVQIVMLIASDKTPMRLTWYDPGLCSLSFAMFVSFDSLVMIFMMQKAVMAASSLPLMSRCIACRSESFIWGARTMVVADSVANFVRTGRRYHSWPSEEVFHQRIE